MIPLKTAQGQEELTQRRHGLGQRHRTVLLLVDGRRNLEKVLHMAQQAGATRAHFEELVALGLVALPGIAVQPAPQAVPDGEVDIALHTGLTLPPADEAAAVAVTHDAQLEAARELLVQALRAEAPVTGALTAKKVKRAQGRGELADLLAEVHAKLGKPRKQPEAAAIIRRARDLLGSTGGDDDLPFADSYPQPAV